VLSQLLCAAPVARQALEQELGAVGGGPRSGLDSRGCRAIWSAEGEVLAQLEGLGSGLVIARESEAGWSARSVTQGD